MMVPTEEFSEFLRGVLVMGLDDQFWLGYVRGWVPESVTSEAARVGATYWAVEALLDRSLMVVEQVFCVDGSERKWPRELSAQEVVNIAKAYVPCGRDALMDWDHCVWFNLSDVGAQLGFEARLIDAGETVGGSVGALSGVESLRGLDVRRLLAEACAGHAGGVGFVASVDVLDALFSELVVNARPYTPGNRYLGKMFRLHDGTIVGERWVSAFSHLASIDVWFPDRSYEKCVSPKRDILTGSVLPYRLPVGNTGLVSSLFDRVLVRGLWDWVWLAEIDSMLAADGVSVDDVPEMVFGLVRRLIDDGLAMVGCLHAGLTSVVHGYFSWELSSEATVERMRRELLVFGYQAWLWSACIHLTEKGTALAEQLVAAAAGV
jgi:hypothetical protein